jgi:hypothetical protein
VKAKNNTKLQTGEQELLKQGKHWHTDNKRQISWQIIGDSSRKMYGKESM